MYSKIPRLALMVGTLLAGWISAPLLHGVAPESPFPLSLRESSSRASLVDSTLPGSDGDETSRTLTLPPGEHQIRSGETFTNHCFFSSVPIASYEDNADDDDDSDEELQGTRSLSVVLSSPADLHRTLKSSLVTVASVAIPAAIFPHGSGTRAPPQPVLN